MTKKTPIRIQRKRTKGWKMPENTVSVTRPGKWGNPLKLPWVSNKEDAIKTLVSEYTKWLLRGDLKITVDDVKRELKGKNLACWCKPGSPCHADVLLKIANS